MIILKYFKYSDLIYKYKKIFFINKKNKNLLQYPRSKFKVVNFVSDDRPAKGEIIEILFSLLK